MSTTLDSIVNQIPGFQRPVKMPRIVCKDGVSLSVQAFDDFGGFGCYCKPKFPPYKVVEVAFIAGTELPEEWRNAFVENHHSALITHDKGDLEVGIFDCEVYALTVEEVKSFIEAHGGEA